MDTETTTTTENKQETTDKQDLDNNAVRNHPLFAKVAKEAAAQKARVEKYEADRAEQEKQAKVNLEMERGNFEAARKELEAQYSLEKSRQEAAHANLMHQLEMTKASTKLIAAGAQSEEVAEFVALKYYAIPAEERPDFAKWIEATKGNEAYSAFFSKPAGWIPAPGEKSGPSSARSGGESAKMREVLENPGKFSSAEVLGATKWRAAYFAQNGKSPW